MDSSSNTRITLSCNRCNWGRYGYWAKHNLLESATIPTFVTNLKPFLTKRDELDSATTAHYRWRFGKDHRSVATPLNEANPYLDRKYHMYNLMISEIYIGSRVAPPLAA